MKPYTSAMFTDVSGESSSFIFRVESNPRVEKCGADIGRGDSQARSLQETNGIGVGALQRTNIQNEDMNTESL
jgi:hypothetical protein